MPCREEQEQDLEVAFITIEIQEETKEYGQWRSVNTQVIITLIWTAPLTHMESSPAYDMGSNIKESVVPTSKHTMRGAQRHSILP